MASARTMPPSNERTQRAAFHQQPKSQQQQVQLGDAHLSALQAIERRQRRCGDRRAADPGGNRSKRSSIRLGPATPPARSARIRHSSPRPCTTLNREPHQHLRLRIERVQRRHEHREQRRIEISPAARIRDCVGIAAVEERGAGFGVDREVGLVNRRCPDRRCRAPARRTSPTRPSPAPARRARGVRVGHRPAGVWRPGESTDRRSGRSQNCAFRAAAKDQSEGTLASRTLSGAFEDRAGRGNAIARASLGQDRSRVRDWPSWQFAARDRPYCFGQRLGARLCRPCAARFGPRQVR